MALIGENGYVAISNIERTLGLTPTTSMVRVVEALSCALDLNKVLTPSAALSAGRGVRNSVITATTREGSVPCESVPLSAIGTQLYAAFGEMTDIGTLSTGSVVDTTLDGAVLKGAATIKLTDDSNSTNGKIYQIGTGRNAECVKQVTVAASVITLEYQTRFATLRAKQSKLKLLFIIIIEQMTQICRVLHLTKISASSAALKDAVLILFNDGQC